MTANRNSRRIESLFAECRRHGRGALLPFLTAGIADRVTLARIIFDADKLGVAGFEIGFPYSDSIADGPVIQNSFHVALENGFRVEDAFALAATVRPTVNCSLLAMISYSMVECMGVQRFVARAAESGFDGLILPDLPHEESSEARRECDRQGLCLVGFVAPTTAPERRAVIAREAGGFIYQVAVAGTTGERAALPVSLAEDVRAIRALCNTPVCVGFGISTPEHVRQACRVSDGAIVGSAYMRRILGGLTQGRNPEQIVATSNEFLGQLVAATRPCPGAQDSCSMP